jgi:Ribosomal protein L13
MRDRYAFIHNHDDMSSNRIELVNLDKMVVAGKASELNALYYSSLDQGMYSKYKMKKFWKNLPLELVIKIIEHMVIGLYYSTALQTLGRFIPYFPESMKPLVSHLFGFYNPSLNNKLLHAIRIVYSTVAICTDTFYCDEELNPRRYIIYEGIGPTIQLVNRDKHDFSYSRSQRLENYIFEKELLVIGVADGEVSSGPRRTYRCLNDDIFNSHLLYHQHLEEDDLSVFKVRQHLTPVFAFEYQVYGTRITTDLESYDSDGSFSFRHSPYQEMVTPRDLYTEEWKILTHIFKDLYGSQATVIVNDEIRFQ